MREHHPIRLLEEYPVLPESSAILERFRQLLLAPAAAVSAVAAADRPDDAEAELQPATAEAEGDPAVEVDGPLAWDGGEAGQPEDAAEAWDALPSEADEAPSNAADTAQPALFDADDDAFEPTAAAPAVSDDDDETFEPTAMLPAMSDDDDEDPFGEEEPTAPPLDGAPAQAPAIEAAADTFGEFGSGEVTGTDGLLMDLSAEDGPAVSASDPARADDEQALADDGATDGLSEPDQAPAPASDEAAALAGDAGQDDEPGGSAAEDVDAEAADDSAKKKKGRRRRGKKNKA